MTQYRPICLVQGIGLKLFASIMLTRLSAEVGEDQRSKNNEGSNNSCNPGPAFYKPAGGRHKNEKYLPVTQGGFRKGRLTRDNSFALITVTLVNLAIKLGERLMLTFLDLWQAFDSVSHACLAWGRCGVPAPRQHAVWTCTSDNTATNTCTGLGGWTSQDTRSRSSKCWQPEAQLNTGDPCTRPRGHWQPEAHSSPMLHNTMRVLARKGEKVPVTPARVK